MPLKKPTTESLVFRAALIFFFGFILLTMLWVRVSDSYCYVITLAASKVLAAIKDAKLEGVVKRGDSFYVSMEFLRGQRRYVLGVTLLSGVSRYYSFTVPLTLSLLASLSLFIKKRKRAWAETLLILLTSHVLFVLFVEGTTLTEQAMINGIDPVNATLLSVYQYLWKATEFTVMSFGPFLIALYVFVRFRK
jgi:hypothetical protein